MVRFSATFLLGSLLHICALPIQAEERLHVMLQGTSAEAMQQLVTEQEGEITHFLPIIDAVGAHLTPDQLTRVLDSGSVERVIDDLANEVIEEDAAPDEPACDIGGALELGIGPRQLTWQLYNKQSTPARLQQITAAWPATLGEATALHLNELKLALDAADSQPGELTLQLDAELAPWISDSSTLALSLETPPDDWGEIQQRDIEISVDFDGDCSTKTIPGYRDNAGSFHYAAVAGADNLHRHDIRGQGITVAVLDSGLWEHELLARDSRGTHRVLARYNAITDNTVDETFDESGHGTHLTSVIAHSGKTLENGRPDGSFKGIAPDSRLVAVKAFDVDGQGAMLDIVRGVQWVVDNRDQYDIRVLNLSFASRPRWPYWLDPINQAVMQAWNQGIVVVAAAGNEGPEPMTIGSPGNLPYIITVGATTDSWTPRDRSDDYIPDFSSRGPTPDAHIKPDIVAPGGHITGITRPGSSLTLKHPNYMLSTGDFVMTGSSQAAALVSGLTALLLQLEPDLTPNQVKCMLTSSAEPAINADGLLAYSPFQQGSGQVNIVRAITLGARNCGNEGLDLAKDIAGEDHFEGPAILDDQGATSLPGLDAMLSPLPAAKGESDTRVWGVKDHVERLDPESAPSPDIPFDWQRLYRQEKARLQQLETSAAP